MFQVNCDLCKKAIAYNESYRILNVGFAVSYPRGGENDLISKLGLSHEFHLHDTCWDKIENQLISEELKNE